MERIVFLERNTFTVEFPRPRFEHDWVEYARTTPGEILERLTEATIAIVNKLPLRESELAQLPRLKMIAVAATGVDNIDLSYCRSREIVVSNVRNYARHSLPEHVLMLILALRRQLTGYREDVRRGMWQQSAQFCLHTHAIHDIDQSTLGIIGYGALGQAVERLARAVGMRVLVAERKHAQTIREGRADFEEILRSCDVVTLHCPLTAETRNLIGAIELEMMQPHAILINTARGGLVDESALAHSLLAGKIGGAAFDVLTTEPPREGNPLLDLQLPNFILTPHVAWASQEAQRILADQLVDNLEAFVTGRPQMVVT
ncbi:MAG TPA: D-2-hydroxyacid dehydrogenase [Pyrinomonadaceae bacterium]|nr:D-2-hydroxyacid dehydrogenase [Pyrinomonadaceae bacterium]